MRKLFVKVLAIAMTVTLASCNSDFLTEHPVDQMYADNLLVNYSGFNSMLSAQRGLMRNEQGNFDGPSVTMNAAFNGGSDLYFGNQRTETAIWWNWPNYITQYTEGAIFEEIFSKMYNVINVSNMIINRAENNASVDWEGGSDAADEAHKTSVIAQAKFFRAWAYRHLTYTYGDVPLSLEEITGSNYRADWNRDPVEKVREAMIEDLKYCVEHLDWRVDGNNTKPNQAISRVYLAETYLAMNDPESAVSVLKPLCEASPYRLMTTRFGSNAANPGNCFIDLFRSPLYSQGNNEVLYAFLNAEAEDSNYENVYGIKGCRVRNMYKTYYSNLSEVSGLSHPDYPGKSTKLFCSLNGGKGIGRLSVPIKAWKLYEYDGQQDNDIRYDQYSVTKHLYFLDKDNKVYEVLDKNGNPLVNLNPTKAMFATTEGTIKNYYLPSTKKWDYVHSNFEKADADANYQDLVYMRLAEAYLLYAEALYKTGGDAAYWINLVRRRAGVSEISAADVTIDFILDERARELMCEGQRRHPLIRLSQENGGDERDVDNYFKRRVRECNEVAGQVPGTNEWGYETVSHGMDSYETPVLFALPKVFIDSNTKVKITQNPGYPGA